VQRCYSVVILATGQKICKLNHADIETMLVYGERPGGEDAECPEEEDSANGDTGKRSGDGSGQAESGKGDDSGGDGGGQDDSGKGDDSGQADSGADDGGKGDSGGQEGSGKGDSGGQEGNGSESAKSGDSSADDEVSSCVVRCC